MFRYFENLVDPFVAYEETDTPPTRLWPFMLDYSRPFMRVFFWAGLISVVVAAVEVGLIYYMGRVVDLLSGPPAEVWQAHGTELILVALFVLLLRPMLHVVDVLLLNNTILPNFGTLIRWRAHKHVLRQSVGWFENDFAGRIANRIMQTPPAAGEAVFQVFDAISFSLAYLIGAAVLLMAADPRLLLPLLIWLVLYGLLVRWTVARVGPASQAASDARSAVTGRVVDSYTNIHSVKMFAHGAQELDYAREAIEETRRTFQVEMRIFTIMDAVLVALNGLLIVGVVGWAIALWMQGSAIGWCGRGGHRPDPAAECDDRLDHVGADQFLPPARRCRRGDGDDCPAHRPAGCPCGQTAAPVRWTDRYPRVVAPLRAEDRRVGSRQPDHSSR